MSSLEEYAPRYARFARFSREDGILEVRLHTNDRECRFDGLMHRELGELFHDVATDPGNRIVILTGTGERFMHLGDMDFSTVSQFLPYTPEMHVRLIPESVRLLQNFLSIEVPVISAVNGAASVHAEIPVLADIVLAAQDATFSDSFHFVNGVVPGDGSHVIWPMLLGYNRARYFLMTDQKITAEQAQQIGFVNEVLPREALLRRAWELARDLARQPDVTLRATRQLFIHPFRRALANDLVLGLGMEGIGMIHHFPTSMRNV